MSGHTRQQKDMEGQCRFNREDLHSNFGEEFSTIGFVEDMMMEAAIPEVVGRSLAKFFRRAGWPVHVQVVSG